MTPKGGQRLAVLQFYGDPLPPSIHSFHKLTSYAKRNPNTPTFIVLLVLFTSVLTVFVYCRELPHCAFYLPSNTPCEGTTYIPY